MSLRETLNRHPGAVASAAGVFLLIAAFVLYRQLSDDVRIPDTNFYTSDDGQTYFRDSISLVPPFQKEGKEAVIARVFEINGERKVAYLERYAPEAKKIIDDFRANAKSTQRGPPPELGRFIGAQQTGRQFKRPGDASWTNVRDTEKVNAICTVKNADGNPARQIDP